MVDPHVGTVRYSQNTSGATMNTNTLFLFESYYEENADKFSEGPLLIAGVKSTREVDVSLRFRGLGKHVVIAEPFAANTVIAEDLHPHAEVLGCSVLDVPNLERFRTVVWLQGPEHVELNAAKKFLSKLTATADLIVVEMPHGIHPQGADGGNDHEKHLSFWFPKDFDDLGPGWEVHCSHDGKPKHRPDCDDNRHLFGVFWSRAVRT